MIETRISPKQQDTRFCSGAAALSARRPQCCRDREKSSVQPLEHTRGGTIDMKKQLAILLAGILLLGALCGCKHTAAPQTAIPDVTAIPAPTAEPTAAPVDPLAEVDKAEITESKHAREEAYAAVFRTKMLETPLAAVHLEDNDAYSDEALRALAKTVVTDLLTLKEQLSETPRRVTVYITQQMSFGARKYSQTGPEIT